jgi:hypothetical protein
MKALEPRRHSENETLVAGLFASLQEKRDKKVKLTLAGAEMCR